MRKPIEIRIKRVNKTIPALYSIIAVWGLMDTTVLPYVCDRKRAIHHTKTLFSADVPVIWESNYPS